MAQSTLGRSSTIPVPPASRQAVRRVSRGARLRTGLLLLVTLLSAVGAIPGMVLAQDPLPPPPSPLGTPSTTPPPLPPPPSPIPNDPAAGFAAAETAHIRFRVQLGAALDAPHVQTAYGPIAEAAYAELSAIFGVTVTGKIAVNVFADLAGFEAAVAALPPSPLAPIGAAVDPATATVSVALPTFAARTPTETENALRHAIARVLLEVGSGGNLPRGFAEGMAQYAERPVTPRLARVAATLDRAAAANGLLSWSDLNRDRPPSNDLELIRAESYAAVAFLVDRHGLRAFKGMMAALRVEPDWRPAMRETYDRDPGELEQQWRDNVPRWAASEWRDNLVAAFDVAPAKELLSRAEYAGAKVRLEQSHRLFTDLGDAARLAEADALLRQCEVGIGAETSLAQAQEAIERHTYDRAWTLTTQARSQYGQLPPEQRPDELLAAYDELVARGLAATADLDEAQRRSRRWNDYPEARAAALSAGRAFASLGDEEMTGRARTLLDDLDGRQRRLVLMLGALAALTTAWLVLWLWVRGPPELDWR